MTERERAPATGFAADDIVAIVLINLMWGLNIVAVKLSVDLIAPFTAAFLRQAMVFLLCLPWLRIVPGRMTVLLVLGIVAGAMFFIPLNLALAHTENTATVAIAGQLGAPFALILSIIFLGDRIGIPRIAGIFMTFAGVMVIAFDPAAADDPFGLLLTATSALFWAISSLLQRKLAGVPVLVLYAWIGLCGSAILAPTALLFEPHAMRDLTHIPLVALCAVLFSAVCSTLIGQGGMAWLLQRHPISTVIPYTLVAPVVSVIAAAAFFGTPITGVMILGSIMVLAGVAIVTIRTARKSELPEDVA